ncbi:MAG: GAF domain-containing protein, partial [Chloroflexi bacterium]|nr:GAF domain-containing protein [Chloroflexota bacterium]
MAQTNNSHSSNQMSTAPQAHSKFLIARLFAQASLRVKLIVAFLVVSILSVGAMAYITNQVVRNQLTQQVGTGLKATAQLQAERIDNVLAKQLELMQGFGLNEAVHDNVEAIGDAYTGNLAAIKAEIENLDRQWRAAAATGNEADPLVAARLNNDIVVELNEFRHIFADHVELLVTDKYGALAAATNRPPAYNLAGEAWWQAAYNNGQGSFYVGQPELDETGQDFIITLAVPLFGHSQDDVVGVFRSDYRLREIVDILGEFGSRGGADLLVERNKILREEGDIVPLDEATLAQLREQASADYGEFFYDEEYSLVSQAPIVSADPEEKVAIDRLDWVLILDENPTQVLEPVDTVTRTILLIGLGVLIMAGLAALVVAQLLAGPITRLPSVVRQITTGDLSVQARVESGDEIGVLSASFNTMVNQLRQTLDQVVTRTNQVEVILNVSQRLSAILDLDGLMREVVTITKETFNYYHVHIYLLDETRETLVVAEGYGQAGAEMKRQGHHIPLDAAKSLVARAARENTIITVENVRLNPDWLPNPLLPETYSEMAVPVILEDKTVGVLDVQSDRIGGLTSEDQVILQLLANQIAIATHNAHVFSETQVALREAQKLQQLYTGQAWERFSATQTTDYEFRQAALPPLQEVATPEAIAVLQRERTVTLGAPTSEFNSENLDHQPPPP